VAIAGRRTPPTKTFSLEGVDLPERTLVAHVKIAGQVLTAVSYHAPPGVSWKIVKPRQAVAFTRWLARQRRPVILGTDANTPQVDAIDHANTRTHWHTGKRRLEGEPGDDLMFAKTTAHRLSDALRLWLDPDVLERLAKGATRWSTCRLA
jgi:hypothetical protein